MMPAVELVRMTEPPSPRSTIDGNAARVALKTPVRLMSIMSFHCSDVISQATAHEPMPAFAQTMSMRPSSARPASTTAWTWSRSRTSAMPLTALRPLASTAATVSSRSSGVESG